MDCTLDATCALTSHVAQHRWFSQVIMSLKRNAMAAVNAQMGPKVLVVQLRLTHADLSRRLQANDAEHQRLWDTIEETKSEVGNLGGKLSNVHTRAA